MRLGVLALCALFAWSGAAAQEPASWGDNLEFATFSIAAVDPETGETGVAVTTRVAYGTELLALMAGGMTAQAALAQEVAADSGARRRQVGVIGLDGRGAQHTGDRTNPWAGHRAGMNYVTQGNLLEGPQVLDAVARSFEESAGQGRHLADRLIAALSAGQAAGGDARKGRAQSAAVVVADPRPDVSRRPDRITANINVCEHPEPVAEVRRIYDAVSQTLGYRDLQQFTGNDVWQLRVILHALGVYRPDADSLVPNREAFLLSPDLVQAIDAWRAAQGLSTPANGSPPGLVDRETVARLWAALAEQGKEIEVRERLKRWTAVRR
ncbi:MAG: DUF1028 domain-containing protein [Gemmatimonadota bacterium]|nr:DUF1028 domain-containing protein [Gemmatimonadota bacterium]MDH3368552.1 DUF1028 domain-containing protein [Gemmatimonadota bacterium]MDH3479633.1 DUF1028 domain-containing protein [Gemmatimonadota bacterium]MDH3570347.1 DUF1028 domain-containing protein [Gemmatimonadota bacterium]MDH5549494.1 DUF1028 domain-containing protein [Gemmatimonadota bacterium]